MENKKSVETWTLENGNICFRYKGRKFRQDIWWYMLIPFIVCSVLIGRLVPMLAEFIGFGWSTFVLVVPCIFFLILTMLNSLARTCKKNERTEQEIIWNILCDKIQSDVAKYDETIKVVRYKYQIDTKGTVSNGTVLGQWLIVLLSNDKALEYTVEYHQSEGKMPFYYEVLLEPAESTNPEHLKVIQRRKLIKSIKTRLEKMRSTMWILAIIIFGLSILFLSIYVVATRQWRFLIVIAIYFILRIPIRYFLENKENKVVSILWLVVDIPFTIVRLLVRFALPACSMIIGFLFMTIFALIIPGLSMFAVDFFFQTNFTYPTYVFVIISAATILCVYCSKFMRYLISKHTPLRDWGDHEYQKLSLDLALYVLHKKNITFLIYFAYFVFMAITGFKQIQYGAYVLSSDIDLAVTKAFLVFIAFTNMFSKSLEVDITLKELFVKFSRLVLSHDEQPDE